MTPNGVDSISAGRRLLIAVLLNPPTGDGKRTNKHLQIASENLRCDAIEIVNLYPGTTKNLAELGRTASHPHVWIEHRTVIATALSQGDEVLLGWGVSLPAGHARKHMAEQIQWVIEELHSNGIEPWVLGDGPRHPSRWHQYVSDRHGRTSGGSLAERFQESLVRLSCPLGKHPLRPQSDSAATN